MDELEEQVEIANPGEVHCPVILLLDTSRSMSVHISSMNEEVPKFRDDIMDNELARKRVELSVVQFGGSVRVCHEFSPVEEFDPPQLSANGGTPMGEAILRGIDLLKERKEKYKKRAVDYYRPFFFLFTDGQPTDMQPGGNKWNEVAEALKEGTEGNHFVPLMVGADDSSVDRLQHLAVEGWPVIQLEGFRFDEMFEWLSTSVVKTSESEPGEQVSVEPSEGALTLNPSKAS